MFSYDLPKELIAKRLVEPRDSARLLVLDRATAQISHRIFRDLSELLSPGDCLVLNDTRVLAARLYGRKAITGGAVELLVLGPYEGTLPPGEQAGSKVRYFRCIGQPAKNLKPGTRLNIQPSDGKGTGTIQAQVIAWEEGERIVRFEGRDVEIALYSFGEVPLPPYIDRPVQAEDAHWYQTVFARQAGAVAAPTAGLHFTPELIERIRAKGVQVVFLTLHVGWGTFKPVGERELAEGKLHAERFSIPQETLGAIESTKTQNKKVIAVGTTVVRALETWAMEAMGDAARRSGQAGLDRPSGQGVPSAGEVGRAREEESESPRWGDERTAVRSGSAGGRPHSFNGQTELFIQPGFSFKVVDAMVTNFHLPGTSLLLLVSAFAGEKPMQEAYHEAIRQKYRFYSYGDAMLIL